MNPGCVTFMPKFEECGGVGVCLDPAGIDVMVTTAADAVAENAGLAFTAVAIAEAIPEIVYVGGSVPIGTKIVVPAQVGTGVTPSSMYTLTPGFKPVPSSRTKYLPTIPAVVVTEMFAIWLDAGMDAQTRTGPFWS